MKSTMQLVGVLLLALLVAGQPMAESTVLHRVKGQPLAADFTLMDADDVWHKLGDYRGKVVIINFWASWCPPCRYELPSMERLWQKVKDKNVIMLAINIGEDADTIFEFTSEYMLSFPLLMDLDSSVIQKYPVLGIPTTFVIDPDGRLVYRAVGTREWDDEEMVKQVLSLSKEQ